MTVAVEARQLTRMYRGRSEPALREVDFTIGVGEVVGLLGPNGAGKTTLVKLICGIARATSGTLEVLGGDPARDVAKVKPLVAAVHQDAPMDNMLPAVENLRIAAVFRGLRWRDVRDRAERLMAEFGIADVAGQLTFTLSGGQRQRLQLVRALLRIPRLLLLDEPTVGLDVEARRQLWDTIATVNAQDDVTVIWTSHYLDEIERNCDRVIMLDRGRVVADQKIGELVTGLGSHGLEEAYLRLAGSHEHS
jgi:ABC-type multidrug transport system ATPase subunit